MTTYPLTATFLEVQKKVFFAFCPARMPETSSNIDFSDICHEVQSQLDVCSKIYEKVFIITYSSGSEVLFNLHLAQNVKAAQLWSPSYFFLQNVTSTLTIDPHDSDFLLLANEARISKKLAKDLDTLDTAQSRKNLLIQHTIIHDKESASEEVWPNAINYDFAHSYSPQEFKFLLTKAEEWFHTFFL